MRSLSKLASVRALCVLAVSFSAACVGEDEIDDELDDGGAIIAPVGDGGVSDGGAQLDGQVGDGGAPAQGQADASAEAGRPSDGGATDASTATDAQVVQGDGGADVPASAHCEPARAWNSASAQLEQEVLVLTNAARAVARTCGTQSYPAVKPVTMQANLRCSARLHSAYMASSGDFNHTTKAGSTFSARITAAGYTWSAASENIAAGQTTAKQVVDGWIKSEGHCKNIMDGTVTQLGVGYAVRTASGKTTPYWTQNFAKPR